MGPTLVSYLRGGRSRGNRTVVATIAATAAGMAKALWLAVVAAVGGCAAVATAAVGGDAAAAAVVLGPGLDSLAGGGEEWLTSSLKLCPSHVLTMHGPEKGRRWRE